MFEENKAIKKAILCPAIGIKVVILWDVIKKTKQLETAWNSLKQLEKAELMRLRTYCVLQGKCWLFEIIFGRKSNVGFDKKNTLKRVY